MLRLETTCAFNSAWALLQCAAMKPSLKALPPSEWRVMYLLWRHGPLTVAEVHRLSPEHNLTTVATFLKRLVAKGYLSTTIERSPSIPGRPPERYFPKVDYQAGLELVVQRIPGGLPCSTTSRGSPTSLPPPGSASIACQRASPVTASN